MAFAQLVCRITGNPVHHATVPYGCALEQHVGPTLDVAVILNAQGLGGLIHQGAWDGVKSEWYENRILANVAVFRSNYSDLQSAVSTVTAPDVLWHIDCDVPAPARREWRRTKIEGREPAAALPQRMPVVGRMDVS